MLRYLGAALLFASSLAASPAEAYNTSVTLDKNLLQSQHLWSLDNRPAECPPWYVLPPSGMRETHTPIPAQALRRITDTSEAIILTLR